MKITKKYVTNNMHYRNNIIIDVKRLVLHSVGVPQPNPYVFIKQWDTGTNKYLSQMIIGKDHAYECLPCMNTSGKATFCWHAGNVNKTSIGIEMTEPSTIKYIGGSTWKDLNPVKTKEHVMATYNNAVDVFAQLCKFHKLDPLADGVILSHYECYRRGIGTNHGDVEHIWSKFGLTMDKFRHDVKVAMQEVPFLTKVSIDDLNMRIGPGVKYDRIGYIPKGVYTIVELNDEWGKLKSQQLYRGKYVDAWIHTGYTTKVRND